jgi:aspartyl aminopeptidase
MVTKLVNYLDTSYTAFHAVKNAKKVLLDNGFSALSERATWKLEKGGKYFVERGESAIIAFTIGNTDNLVYKIVASHTDSPALKIKENPLLKCENYYKLNVEKYGGGILYSFLDRPLKIAGRIITEHDGAIRSETLVSDYTVTIPSLAIHMNRSVNDGAPLNAQVDMCPLFTLANSPVDFIETLTNQKVYSYDLYLVNDQKSYEFGVNGEFIGAPRIDNLSSVYSSLTALTETENKNGICIAACLDNEEIGNQSAQGSAGDFLENTLKRIAYALGFNEENYAQALAKSFLLSLDVAHAVHPNHPEKHDPSNRTALGGGVAIKYNANLSYVTDGKSSAVIKALFDKANVKYQTFFSRSDMPCGSTLGRSFITRVGMLGVDVGLPQLAMHSACESFAKSDYIELTNGLSAFYQTKLDITDDGVKLN